MLPEWFRKPEVIYTTILFALGVLVSLYPSKVRYGLGFPGRKAKEKILKSLENDLRALELIHGNAYYLLLWLAWGVFDVMRYMIIIFVVSSSVNFTAYLMTGKLLWTSAVTGFVAPSMGGVIGRTLKNYDMVMGLYDYDNRTTKLRRMISDCRGWLGIQNPPSG